MAPALDLTLLASSSLARAKVAHYALIAAAGAVASVINLVAGGGGFVVLPTLMALGLPAGTANGTFRLGLVAQNLSGIISFKRHGISDFGSALRLLPAVALGAVAGAYAATHIPGKLLKPIFGWVFVAWTPVLALKPERFKVAAGEDDDALIAARRRAPWVHALGLVIGGYGGFIQAGVGVPLVLYLVGAVRLAPVRGNAVKVVLVLGYTLLSLPLFVMAKQVHWAKGAALAAGMLVGGYAGVRLQTREGGAKVVRWGVLLMVLVSGLLMALR